MEGRGVARAALRARLRRLAGVEVVAEARNWRAALSRVDEVAPDVVVLGVGPSLHGLDAAARIGARHPTVRTLVLSRSHDEVHVLRAIRAGASGYVLDSTRSLELQEAIRAVMRGETYLAPEVIPSVTAAYVRRARAATSSPATALTPRQREVLALIAEGHTSKEIAGALGIAIKTVESHRSAMMAALGIHHVAGLVRYAIRTGEARLD